MSATDLHFIAYEDRPTDCIGLKLLAASLFQANPQATLVIYCPASFTRFRDWAVRYPRLAVRDSGELTVRGWEVKPTLLLKALDEGVQQPIWIDGDIVVSRTLTDEFLAIPNGTLLTTQEHQAIWHRKADRAALSGLVTAREVPVTINASVVRVSEVHRPLLLEWARRMTQPDFQEAQVSSKPRPIHLAYDGDVLEALLCSTLFSSIPIRQLRSGIDIAQCWFVYGFTFAHRFRALFFGLPPLVHALGIKPWRATGNRVSLLSAQLNPYNIIARRLQDQVQEEMSWTRPQSPAAVVLQILGFGSLLAAGLWLQIVYGFYAKAVWVAHGFRKPP